MNKQELFEKARSMTGLNGVPFVWEAFDYYEFRCNYKYLQKVCTDLANNGIMHEVLEDYCLELLSGRYERRWNDANKKMQTLRFKEKP